MNMRNTSSLPSILVTGVGGPAGKSAVSYLANKDCCVIGTDMRSVDSSVTHFIEVPAAGDVSFIPTILKIIREFEITLLIPTVSEELPVIARAKTSFTALGCQVMIAPHHAVDIANDKLKTAQFMERHGIAVPFTLTEETPHTAVIETLGLPVIAKPRVSRGGRGVVLHASAKQLAEERRNGIIYQEFMSGEEYDVNLFVNHKGKLQSCVVLLKTCLREGLVGNALAVKRVQRDDIAELCSQAVKVLGLIGPADIDVRIDASGTPRLLEINARLGANSLSAPEVLDDLWSDWKSFTQQVEGIS
jgi:carbamoyl-phosphate synthase large subunit